MAGRICSVDGCGRKYSAKGLCRSHYGLYYLVKRQARAKTSECRVMRQARQRTPEYRAKERARERTPKYRAKRRAIRRRRDTCWTQAGFDAAWSAQNGKCAVSGAPLRVGPGGHAADHCHVTMHPRGLLTMRVNTALGSLEDSPELCRKAAHYLEWHSHPSTWATLPGF